MFLERLIVRTSSSVIRDIPFKEGLNLIVDETSTKQTDSGNNVGKTTFLRAIDYCLGGSKDPIFKDREFGKTNEKIFNFLDSKNVQFELHLKKGSQKVKIMRPFDGKGFIDGQEISSQPKFMDEIKKILFNFTESRPTLGQLMNKFVRIEDYQISNTLYFLHNTSDKSEYEALFLFLFGFRDTTLLSRKRQLVERHKKLKKKIEDASHSVEDLEQQLHLIDKAIKEHEENKKAFNFNKSVDLELAKLKVIQNKVADLKVATSQLNLKISLNKDTLGKLEDSKSTLNVDAIEAVYKQAQINLPKLSKKFGEVLNFHNQMIDNKIKFIQSSLEKLSIRLSGLRKELNDQLDEESKIVKIMSDKGALDEYDKLSLKLQNQYQEKGNKEGLIQSLLDTTGEFRQINSELNEVNEKIGESGKNFDSQIKAFNEFFSDFSQRLYEEKYYLVPIKSNNKITDNYLLNIGNLRENVGTGKKKAQISALDLAYLKYSDGIEKTPHFVLHDQLEVVYENQIETLFNLANSINGQFVVAVLSDKLKKLNKKLVEKYCILKLSQNDKFFKVT